MQHRDGGIVQSLEVREGQHVKAGQILIRLKGQVAATERALAGSVIDLQAQRARLEADIRGSAIQWPASFANATGDDANLVARAKQLQLAQRNARSNSLASNRARPPPAGSGGRQPDHRLHRPVGRQPPAARFAGTAAQEHA
ncbi:biotin/lipoyl-binding protein [Sphingomonas sp. MMS24-JH45]